MKTTLDLIEKDLEKQAELRAGHKPADDSEAEDDEGINELGVLMRSEDTTMKWFCSEC